MKLILSLLWLVSISFMPAMVTRSEDQRTQTAVISDMSFLGYLKNISDIDRAILEGGYPGELALSNSRIIFEYKISMSTGPFIIFTKEDGHRYQARFFRRYTVLGLQKIGGEVCYFYHKSAFSENDRELILGFCSTAIDSEEKSPQSEPKRSGR